MKLMIVDGEQFDFEVIKQIVDAFFSDVEVIAGGLNWNKVINGTSSIPDMLLIDCTQAKKHSNEIFEKFPIGYSILSKFII